MCTCETLCERSSGKSFICVVIGLECRLGGRGVAAQAGVAAQVRMAAQVGVAQVRGRRRLGCRRRLRWRRRLAGLGAHRHPVAQLDVLVVRLDHNGLSEARRTVTRCARGLRVHGRQVGAAPRLNSEL